MAGFDLPDLTEKPDRNALSISGGGYAGLFASEALRRLEEHVGRRSADMFDLIAGTSIGGIVALGLAHGVRAEEISRLLRDVGPELFGRRGLGLSRPRYRSDALEKRLINVFGDTKLHELLKPVLIPAVDMTSGDPLVFGNDRDDPTRDEKVVDVALATSAAPVFLKPHVRDRRMYADGGLVANSPEALVALEAVHRRRWKADRTTLLVVGSTLNSTRVPGYLLGARWGLGRWLKDERLMSITMRAQMSLARTMSSSVLGKDNVLVIDAELTSEEAKVVRLDRADAKATATLSVLAATCFTKFGAEHRSYLGRLRD